MPDNEPIDLLVVSHGSSLEPDCYRPIDEIANELLDSPRINAVSTGFLKQNPSLRQGWRALKGPRVVVAPYLASAGFFAERVLPKKLGFPPVEFGKPFEFEGRQVIYTEALGTDPALTDIVETVALEIADGQRGPNPGDTTLVVVGHGTPRHRHSGKSVHHCVARLSPRGIFRDVRAAFVDEKPFADNILDECRHGDVVVVPYFVCDGPHVKTDIPSAFGISKPIFRAPHTVGAHCIWYAHAIGTRREMIQILANRVEEAAKRYSSPPSSRA